MNNAAVFSSERKVTKDGLELMFATNHLGPFLVTNSLIGSLQAAAPARIVSISAPTTTKLDFDDLQSEKDFRPYRAFGASKMCNLLTTFRLSRMLDPNQVTANVVHPGLIKSELMSDTPALLGGLLKAISRRPEKAAVNPVWVATDPDLAGVSGAFFKGKKIGKPAPYSLDESAQDRLWQLSEELVG
jgi:NAD(P)-dependent dehydrogenase (short-subunit alcohol dehydrogenase family)